MCGSNYMVQWHNENYYAPWDAQTVCKPCHKTLHGRFTEPGAWNDLAERAALRLGALALAFSFCIEISQLYQAHWINAIRQTRLGGLVLGHGFLWGDLVSYTLGVAGGMVAEWAVMKRGDA